MPAGSSVRRTFAHTARAALFAGIAGLTLVSPARAQSQAGERDPADQPDATQNGGEIVVTGSRLSNSGFSAPTPVTVVGEEEIARQGATNLSEVLNQLPAFRAANTPTTAAIYANNIGTATADLRALGANRTLVLLDGRRVVPATVQGSSQVPANTVDLNMIPTSLIGRSEVVTGGASAAYGSDAVAGVVNILLETKFTGVRGSLQYGQTEVGDGTTWAASLGYGAALGERGHLIVGGDYTRDKGAGDCYTRDWCTGINQVTNPTRTNGIPAINLLPTTSYATATRNGIINAGPLRGTEFTTAGGTRQHDYGTYYNSGLFQSGGGDLIHPFFENIHLSAPVERYALLGHADYEISDAITVFGELSYAHVTGSNIGAQTRDTAITINRDNPFLPASVVSAMTTAGLSSFTFGRIGDDLGPSRAKVNRSTFRGVAGLQGSLANSWKWNMYYQYGQTDYHQRQYNTRINDNFTRAAAAVRAANGSIVCAVNNDAISTNDDPACRPLNLFGENNFSADAKAYAYGTAIQDTTLKQHVIAAELSGDLLELPAGPLSFATGVEYRADRATGDADPISKAFRFYTGPGAPIAGKVNVKEGFLELGVPLARDAALAHSLDVNGALRVTDYSTSGAVPSWKVGVTWEPVSQLRLRATRSRDIRAPNIFELYGPNQSSFQTVNDPAKQGASRLPLVIIGGNGDLEPEVADTFTAGAVFLPDFLGENRLRLSVDYYDIKLRDSIGSLSAQTILTLCAQGNSALCSQISRDGAGELISIANVNLNINQVKTNGIDFELSYNRPLGAGTVSLRMLATKVFHLTTIDPSGTATDRKGQLGPPTTPSTGGLPSWSGSAFLTYDRGPFSGTFQVRYVSSGVRDVTLIGPDDPRYDPALANSVNINRVPAYALANLNASYSIIDDGARKVTVFGVVNNLLDKDPPNFLPFFMPTNPVLYDVLGRSYRAGVRFSF